MGNISENFSRHEFACDCVNQGKKRDDGYCGGHFDTVDKDLNNCLELIRKDVRRVVGRNVYVRITGGNRCHKHNEDVGGADHSYHLYGLAAGIKVYDENHHQIDNKVVYEVIDKRWPDKYGLKQYKTHIHFDIRKIKWRSPLL